MLFRRKEDRKPELPQKEREAIVDLLHLCMYADAHIALKEGEMLSDVVNVIGWGPESSFSSYEAKSLATVRAVKGDPVERKAFLESVALRLGAGPSRKLALDLCQQLLSADGAQPARESDLLREIRAALR